MFCPKCGSIMLAKNGKLKCSSCSHIGTEGKIKEKVKTKKKEVAVATNKTEVHPKTREECPKCKHPEAYYWMVQTRAADEAPTRFYKCVKCGHTWREYS